MSTPVKPKPITGTYVRPTVPPRPMKTGLVTPPPPRKTPAPSPIPVKRPMAAPVAPAKMAKGGKTKGKKK